MKKIDRRSFLKLGALAGAYAALPKTSFGLEYKKGDIKIGYMAPTNFGVADFEIVKAIGFEGVELQTTYDAETGVFKLFSSPELLKEYKAASVAAGMPVCSVCAGQFNAHPFVYTDKAVDGVKQCIDACNYFGAKEMLLPFFGKGALNDEQGKPMNDKHLDPLVAKLKELAPYAQEKNVKVCLENTLSAKDNMRIIDAVGSKFIGIYYDIANSHKNGYDVPREIRWLGARLNRIHFKDNEGRFNTKNPDVDACVAALKDINYKGWIVLERNFEKESPEAYWKHNMEYTRKAFGVL